MTDKNKESSAPLAFRNSETLLFRVLVDPGDVRLPAMAGSTFSVWPWGEVFWRLDLTGALIQKSDINKLLESEKIARLVKRDGQLVEVTGRDARL